MESINLSFFSNKFLLSSSIDSSLRRDTMIRPCVCSFLTRKCSINLQGWFELMIMIYLELLHLASFVPGNGNSHCLIFGTYLLDNSRGCSSSHFPSRSRESGFERLKAFLSSFNKIVTKLKIEISRFLSVALFHLMLSHWIQFRFPVVLSLSSQGVLSHSHSSDTLALLEWYDIGKKPPRWHH